MLLPGAFAAQPVAPTDLADYPPDIAAILRKGELVIGMVKADEPPFFYTDASGNFTGGDVALAKLIASQLGVKPVFDRSAITYDQVIDEVFRHKVDVGMGLLSITSGRAIRVSFTESYYKFHPSLLVNRLQMAQHGWQQNVLDQMTRAGADVTIGVQGGSAAEQEVRQNFPNVTIIPYDTWQHALQDVVDGKLFAAESSSPLTLQRWMETHVTSRLRAVEVSNTLRTETIGIAVPWQSLNLRYLLTLYIRELDNNGQLANWLNDSKRK